MTIPFRKMHGLGNDFIVFDARTQVIDLAGARVSKLADRRTGIGADTVVVINDPIDDTSDLFIRFFNCDGMEIGTCGNATRCVAAVFFAESNQDTVRIKTIDGSLFAWREGIDVSVDMGKPGLDWRDIYLARQTDTLHFLEDAALTDAVGVSMGNPHAVFFVDDSENIDLAKVGPSIEHHELFLRRVNVEVATVQSPDRIRMRVWERGIGITQACGSGACATLVAAVRRGLTERRATLTLDGGDLLIEWRDDDHVIMTGPAALSFIGEIEDDFGTITAPHAAAA
jgi:diaminopimelate epimerase